MKPSAGKSLWLPLLALMFGLSATGGGSAAAPAPADQPISADSLSRRVTESAVGISVPDQYAPRGSGVILRRARKLFCELLTVHSVSQSADLLLVTLQSGAIHEAVLEFGDEFEGVDVYNLDLLAESPECPDIVIVSQFPGNGDPIFSLQDSPGHAPAVVSGQFDGSRAAGELEVGKHDRQMLKIAGISTHATERGTAVFNKRGELIGLRVRSNGESSSVLESGQTLLSVLDQMDTLRRATLRKSLTKPE
ncbi:MAG TPA: hypothetical protein V6C89_00550 [Drouetiella sp.]|jgi:hypothetical protein